MFKLPILWCAGRKHSILNEPVFRFSVLWIGLRHSSNFNSLRSAGTHWAAATKAHNLCNSYSTAYKYPQSSIVFIYIAGEIVFLSSSSLLLTLLHTAWIQSRMLRIIVLRPFHLLSVLQLFSFEFTFIFWCFCLMSQTDSQNVMRLIK